MNWNAHRNFWYIYSNFDSIKIDHIYNQQFERRVRWKIQINFERGDPRVLQVSMPHFPFRAVYISNGPYSLYQIDILSSWSTQHLLRMFMNQAHTQFFPKIEFDKFVCYSLSTTQFFTYYYFWTTQKLVQGILTRHSVLKVFLLPSLLETEWFAAKKLFAVIRVFFLANLSGFSHLNYNSPFSLKIIL